MFSNVSAELTQPQREEDRGKETLNCYFNPPHSLNGQSSDAPGAVQAPAQLWLCSGGDDDDDDVKEVEEEE